MTTKITNNSKDLVLNQEAISILEAIFKCPDNENTEPAMEGGFAKTASVKFMITMQDENDLRNLGYSQAQIEKMKPQEAKDILQSGTKAVQNLF